MSVRLTFDDVGQGLPLVLLHAFPLSREMWRPQRAALANEWRVLAPDVRGFGGSEAFVGPPSVETIADDVAELLDQRKIREPVVLGGLSMGGYAALAFAQKYPERLRGLILADTRAEPDSDEARANRDRMIRFARDYGAAAVIDAMLPRMVSEATQARQPEVVAEVRRIAAAQSLDAMCAALEALRDRPDATPGLASIRVPTLVVVGADDVLTPPAAAQTLANGIRGARVQIIADAGHLSNLEQPQAFNDAVRVFLPAH
jgi:3-oxoadipate enol-lactonase